MSVRYQAIIWNRQKRIYDATFVGGILLFLALFLGVSMVVNPNATIETHLIRAFGTLAFLMLHVILCIGPLCRLDSRFLPLLYNRRHFGVAMFLVGSGHAAFSVIQFHALGNVNPLESLLTSNTRFDSLSQFPFQQLGLAAWIILFLMAATSHDFWLHALTPKIWKTLHMMVYVAYMLLILHVVLGALQSERHPLLVALLAGGFLLVTGLHLAAGTREWKRDGEQPAPPVSDGFVPVGPLTAIPENRAIVCTLEGERVAVFRHNGKVSALSNVCRHQNGPLGEGKIIDGCVTCPWHGYQYLPDTGMSPPPFDDQVPVFETRIVNGEVFVHPRPIWKAGLNQHG